MNYNDFCNKYYVERKGTNSEKWDMLNEYFGREDLISLWVADTEFSIPEEAKKALCERIEHGAFGYSYIPDSYYTALSEWNEKRYGAKINKSDVRFSFGVIQTLYNCMNIFTNPGEGVAFFSPVYHHFGIAARNTGRTAVECDLINTNGYYTMNYSDFEEKIRTNNVKLFIQCSPHNPVGRCWTEEEQVKVFEICQKYGVIILSDEIHQDLTPFGNQHIPACNVGGGKFKDILITANAASKTFNLASFIFSNIIIYNNDLQTKYDVFIKSHFSTAANLLGSLVAEMCYKYGDDWLEGKLALIRHNYEVFSDMIAIGAPKIVISPLEGTYLMWVDMRGYLKSDDSNHLKEFVRDKCGLAVNQGVAFGKDGNGFIRINLATHPDFVVKAAENIIKCVNEVK